VIGVAFVPLRWLVSYLTVAMREGAAVADKAADPKDKDPAASEPASSDKPPMAPATAPFDPTADRKAIADAMEKQRQLLRSTGAAFTGAIGFVLTALGLTKLFDVFPIPPDPAWRFGLVLGVVSAGTLAAFLGAVFFAGGFFRAQRRVLVGTGAVVGLRGEDQRIASQIYTEHALENDASDIRALELRALRYERIARSMPPDHQALPEQSTHRKQLQDEANRINEVVATALARAAVSVLERRSEAAFGSKRAILAASITVIGIALMFGAAAYSKGERELIDLRIKCQAGVEKGANDACDPVRVTPPTNLATLQKDLDKKTEEVSTLKEKLKAANALADLPEDDRARLALIQSCVTVLRASTAMQDDLAKIPELCAAIAQ
jgi:hypothetical protein